jgi:hypothetical protein
LPCPNAPLWVLLIASVGGQAPVMVVGSVAV